MPIDIQIQALGAGWPELPPEAGAGLAQLLETLVPAAAARIQLWLSDRWQAEIESAGERKSDEADFAQGHHLLYRLAEFAARRANAELPATAAGQFEDMRTASPAALLFLLAGWGADDALRTQRWRRGFELDPQCVALRTALARQLVQRGEIETAINLIADYPPQDAVAASSLGLAFWAEGSDTIWPLAQRLLQQAVAADRQNALAAAALAALLARQSATAGAAPDAGAHDRLDEALLLATQATQLASDDYRTWAALADVHRAGGDYRQAGFYYGFALRLEPAAPTVLKDAGANWLLAGEPRQALPLIEQALAVAPEDAENFGNLTLAHDALGDGAAALAAARQARQLKPDDPRFAHLLAAMQEKVQL